MRLPLLCSVLLLGVLTAAAGCRAGGPGAPPDPGDAAAIAVVEQALNGCLGGDAPASIARLDTLLAARPGDVDALATRGMCHRVRFAADSSRADAEQAMDDLTAAIERLAGGGASAGYTLDRLYAHRAYVHEALDRGVWTEVVADLERAVAAAPDEPTHRLDLGVAKSLAGDTTAAIADLRRFLAMAPTDSARGPVVRRHLAALGDSAALAQRPLR